MLATRCRDCGDTLDPTDTIADWLSQGGHEYCMTCRPITPPKLCEHCEATNSACKRHLSSSSRLCCAVCTHRPDRTGPGEGGGSSAYRSQNLVTPNHRPSISVPKSSGGRHG